MGSVTEKVMEHVNTDSPFLGAFNLIKETTGADYCALIVYNNSEIQSKWHYIEHHSNDTEKRKSISIPDSFLSEALEAKKELYFESDPAGGSGHISPELPFKQLLLVPLSEEHMTAVLALGKNEIDEELNNKKKIEKLSSLLQSIEHILNFLYKYDKALELSLKDDLTKAYNRRYLDRALREELSRASRNNSKLSFIFFDLNDFRAFNDNYGHYYGSRLLVYITHKIMENVRGIDKFVRYGGDEFCVILPDTPVEGAVVVARRILDVLKKLDFPTPDGKKVTLSACFGVSSYPENAKNVKDLICEADRAMYSAKENGEDITIITREISEKMQKRNVDV